MSNDGLYLKLRGATATVAIVGAVGKQQIEEAEKEAEKITKEAEEKTGE